MRIVSIEPDGTIKIMRINSIGNQAWDSSNSIIGQDQQFEYIFK